MASIGLACQPLHELRAGILGYLVDFRHIVMELLMIHVLRKIGRLKVGCRVSTFDRIVRKVRW